MEDLDRREAAALRRATRLAGCHDAGRKHRQQADCCDAQ
jgi:hypothetical protein